MTSFKESFSFGKLTDMAQMFAMAIGWWTILKWFVPIAATALNGLASGIAGAHLIPN